MGLVLIWYHMTIVVNVVFEEVFALIRIRYIESGERVNVNKKL